MQTTPAISATPPSTPEPTRSPVTFNDLELAERLKQAATTTRLRARELGAAVVDTTQIRTDAIRYGEMPAVEAAVDGFNARIGQHGDKLTAGFLCQEGFKLFQSLAAALGEATTSLLTNAQTLPPQVVASYNKFSESILGGISNAFNVITLALNDRLEHQESRTA